MEYLFEKIADIVDGEIAQPQDDYITNVITDSRSVYQPDHALFIALRGPNHDGHQYIPELIKKGVKCFLVDDTFLRPDNGVGAGFITVPNTLDAFQRLAAHHRKSFTGKVLAISGSNGKTVVKEWLAQLLARLFLVAKNPKSYNSQIGVPISLLQMEPGPHYHILEAGISLPGEMKKLEEIIRPNEGILTNIGDAHQENFADYKAKLYEKLLLFGGAQILFYCKENPIISEGVDQLFGQSGKNLVSWSFGANTDLHVNRQIRPDGTTMLSGLYKKQGHQLVIPFTDSASIENICHIWLFWLYHKFPLDLLQEKIMDLEPIAMRLEQKEGLRGCTLINDYYNADLHSLSIALDLLMNQLPQQKKTLILSDILQTGLGDKQLIERINRLLDDKKLFRFIGIGPMFHSNRSSFCIPVDSYPDTDNFLADFFLDKLNDEAILLKGARKFTFEKISKRLEKRVHNTIVEIRMNNLLDNLNHFRMKMKTDVKIMAMVKAFSYGSGTHEIAKFLAHQRIDYLGVAFADEGVNLRQAGVDVPIMVMNPDMDNLDILIDHYLEPEIYSISVLKAFQEKARKAGITNYPIHIKIDTGMHRLGLQPNEINELVHILGKHNFLEIRSVFSHLTSADIPEKDEYTHQQAKSFISLVNKIKDEIPAPFLTHLVNTAGIQRFPEYHFDMVRLGIGLYGIDPTGLEVLRPVISLKSHISQIHWLKKGEPIGYGNSENINSDGQIAVIPVGYADGLDRRLSNGKGRVQINKQFAPTIGRICMDMCMLNITGIQASEGDEVTLIGPDIPIEEIAGKLDTIPYEILTRIPQRVKRVYLFE